MSVSLDFLEILGRRKKIKYHKVGSGQIWPPPICDRHYIVWRLITYTYRLLTVVYIYCCLFWFCKHKLLSIFLISPDYPICFYFYLEWHWMACFCADMPLRTWMTFKYILELRLCHYLTIVVHSLWSTSYIVYVFLNYVHGR